MGVPRLFASNAIVFVFDEIGFLEHIIARFLGKDILQSLLGAEIKKMEREKYSPEDIYHVTTRNSSLKILCINVNYGKFLRAIRKAKQKKLPTILRIPLILEQRVYEENRTEIRFGIAYVIIDKDTLEREPPEIMSIIKKLVLEKVFSIESISDYRFTTLDEIHNYFVLQRITPLARSVFNLEEAVKNLETSMKNIQEIIENYKKLGLIKETKEAQEEEEIFEFT